MHCLTMYLYCNSKRHSLSSPTVLQLVHAPSCIQSCVNNVRVVGGSICHVLVMTTHLTLPPSNSCSHEDLDRRQEMHDTCVALQMEACLVTTPSHESIVDFAFYKAGQIALLLKDKSHTVAQPAAAWSFSPFQMCPSCYWTATATAQISSVSTFLR